MIIQIIKVRYPLYKHEEWSFIMKLISVSVKFLSPPLNENFEILKIMIFNLILFWKIWKYFCEFFKVHVKGGLNYKNHACGMREHICMRMYACAFSN